MPLSSILSKVVKKVNLLRRKYIVRKFRKRNKNKNFTIISQNCIGGVIYSELGLPFRTPTVNMFIEDENFVKLVENFHHYMTITPIPKCECYIDLHDKSIHYPIIAIDDIELCCLHYTNCQEAIDSWERRKQRVNLDNIYVIANTWNLHERQDLIDRLCKTGYKTIIFTLNKYNKAECFQLKGKYWYVDDRNIVRPNLTDKIPNSPYRYYEKFWDFVTWIN